MCYLHPLTHLWASHMCQIRRLPALLVCYLFCKYESGLDHCFEIGSQRVFLLTLSGVSNEREAMQVNLPVWLDHGSFLECLHSSLNLTYHLYYLQHL
jgi:hypothetical protein